MKIYGTGVLMAPGSSRVIWDFSNGPYDTVNSILIGEAIRQGFSTTEPKPEMLEQPEVIRGTGVLRDPRTGVIAHDFADGDYVTNDPVMVKEANRVGFKIGDEQMGGKPSKGTPSDGRLKKNKAPAPKPATPKRTKK
jgi:hypothetical protein